MPSYTPHELLVHRGRMLLIDDIHQWGEDWLESTVHHIKPSPFANAQGMIPSWVSLEYMCQSIAALEGIKRLAQNKPIAIGFVLGSKKIETFAPYFAQQQSIRVHIEEVMRSETTLGVYQCRIMDNTKGKNNAILAQATIKAAMPDDPHIIINASSHKKRH